MVRIRLPVSGGAKSASSLEAIGEIIPHVMKKLKLQAWLPKEEDEQMAVFDWATMLEPKYPKLRLLSASMNGILTDARFGAKLKRLGRKAGFPDLFLPVRGLNARGYYGAPGLLIEVKRRIGGVVSKVQEAWHQALRAEGYRVEVAYGAEAVKEIIREYLDFDERSR